MKAPLQALIPSSLGTRLALTYSALVLVIMLALGWSLAGAVREFHLRQLRTTLLEETIIADDLLSPLIEEGGRLDDIRSATDELGAALNSRVTVVAADGTVLADSTLDADIMENHAGRPEIQQAIRFGTGSAVRESTTWDVPYFFVARVIADGEAVVRMGLRLDVVEGLSRDIQRTIAVAAIVAAVLMTGAGLFVARQIGTSLEAIRRQAAAVAAGQLDVSVEPAPTRELGDLGRAFNTMTETLKGTLTELERVRSRLEATLANLSDGVVITDHVGHVVMANEAALAMVGAPGDTLGMAFVEVARDHELAELVAGVLSGPNDAADQVIVHGKTGRTLQAAAQRLDAADQRIGVLVLRDMTELRRLEGMRRDFVANVSHELRTPLTSIRALVETLEAGALHDPEVSSDFLSRIIGEVDRLALLVDELLDLARLESGRVRLVLELTEPETVVTHALRRLAPQTERAGLTVELRVESGIPAIVADRARIEQVLLNLVHNAIKFTPSGGNIRVVLRRTGESVEIRVEDTGVGLSPEDLPRVFERFYKADRARRSQGTGLGLAIAKHIVQVHGGSIWAEANALAGAVFAFTLPVAGPTGAETPDDDHSSGLDRRLVKAPVDLT